MTAIIDTLREEHRNIDSLLGVLERELGVFDRGDSPDYEVIREIIAYFEDYPEAYHHPKEDAVVEAIRAHDPAAAARIGDLEAEHRAGARRLRLMAHAVDNVLAGQDLPRRIVDDIIRDFIDHERRHIATEEQVLMPVAMQVLRPDDWTQISATLSQRRDPLSDPGSEQMFSTRCRQILALEQQAEAERA